MNPVWFCGTWNLGRVKIESVLELGTAIIERIYFSMKSRIFGNLDRSKGDT